MSCSELFSRFIQLQNYFLLNYSPCSKNFIYICCSAVAHQIVSYVRSTEVVLMCTIDNHPILFLKNGGF